MMIGPIFGELVRYLPVWLVIPVAGFTERLYSQAASARLLLIHSGVEPVLAAGAAPIRQRLHARLRWVSKQNALMYVALLGQCLQLHISRDAALAVLEAYAGLGLEDYGLAPACSSRTSLKAKLQQLGERRSYATDVFVTALATACQQDFRRAGAAAVAVLETYIDAYRIAPTLGDSEGLRTAADLKEHEVVSRTMFLINTSLMLYGLGRVERSRSLVANWFDLTDAELSNPVAMSKKILEKKPTVPDDFRDLICNLVPTVFNRMLSGEDHVRLVESLLAIKPEFYADPVLIADALRLQPRRGQWVLRTVTLLQALAVNGQHERSLVVWRGLLIDASGQAPAGTEAVVAGISEMLQQIPAFQRPIVQGRLLHTLFGLKESALAVSYAEMLFGLSSTIYDQGPEGVAFALRNNRPGFSPDEGPMLVSGLIASMVDTPHQREKARLISDAYLWNTFDLSTEGVTAALIFCQLLWLWLDLTFDGESDWMKRPQEWSDRLNKCRAAVRFARGTLAGWGETLADRRQLARELADFRRSLIAAGWWLVRSAPSPARRAALQLEVLCWDVELGQRILFERVRFRDGDAPPLHGTPDGVLKEGWSLEPDREPPDPTDYAPPEDDSTPGRFGTFSENLLEGPSQMPGTMLAPVIGDDALARALQSGVDLPLLVNALGDQTILLRAWFTSTRKLVWVAIRTVGESAEVVASGETTDDTAHARLLAAVQWHDAVLKMVWDDPLQSDESLRDLVEEALPLLYELVDGFRSPNGLDSESYASLLRTILQIAAQNRFGSMITGWFAEYMPSSPNTTQARRKARADLQRFTKLLEALAYTRPVGIRDGLTAEFLDWASQVWDLSSLALVLPPIDRGVDLVIDVEGPLHGIPVALLPVGSGGQRLMSLVRSVRTSLSILLALSSPEAPEAATERGDVVTISWFNSDDANHAAVARGEWWLHAGQKIIAGHATHSAGRGLPRRRWRTAARSPVGCAAAIARALASAHTIRTLTVCGHGAEAKSGVRLWGCQLVTCDGCASNSDMLWAGQGTDLRGAQLVLMVSCSIGRLRHLGQMDGEGVLPDVDGFVADLTAHGCRAALAARWPVHCLEAPQFANMVAEEFCAPDRQTGRADRAAALARARKRMLGDTDGMGSIRGLNTVAAFELYGAG
jgi:hypothetical protein